MNMIYGKNANNSNFSSDKYLYINNCGYFENMTKMNVSRKDGRVDYQLIYVKSGSITAFTQKGEITLSSGDVMLYRPNVPQHYSITDTTTFFWIHFSGTEAERLLSFFKNDLYSVGELYEFEKLCKSLYIDYNITNRYNEMIYEGRLISLFGELSTRINGVNVKDMRNFSKIQRALMSINENYRSCPSNDELAKLCNMSRYYFIKVFKETVGVTPQKYRTSLIISKSKQLLENTDHNVNEIAQLMGFDDAMYFSRLFKRSVGVSPTDHRKATINR